LQGRADLLQIGREEELIEFLEADVGSVADDEQYRHADQGERDGGVEPIVGRPLV
jgi:hypothetical protein